MIQAESIDKKMLEFDDLGGIKCRPKFCADGSAV
jgi:hypothetical protein